jgi:glucose/arabinose dehydrogenase
MPITPIVGDDGSNTLPGTAAADVIYGYNPNGPQSLASSIAATRVATGFDQPLFAGAPPGDTSRLFIVEKTGHIKILDLATGQVLATPFLDVSGQILTDGERGLLGLAFDPDFANNGFFYINRINLSGDSEILRYHVSGNPNVADPTSVTTIITINQPDVPFFSNHKAGWLGFGPDGDLYAALGDGGGGGDPLGSGQDINSLLGKMLRLDVHGDDFPDLNTNYAVPSDNPFVGVAGADEIFAYGLRNPWRDSFDRATGDFYIADVGQGQWEEVDIGELGANYGWNTFEGPVAFPGGGPLTGGPAVFPIHSYDHSVGNSITGGYVYRGEGEALQGQYFFADFVRGKVFTLHFEGGSWVATERTSQIVADVGAVNLPSSFGEDARGNLYVVDLDGDVFRLTPVGASADQADILSGLGGNDMLFGGSGNDSLAGGAGADTLIGGPGADTADYSSSPAGVNVSLVTGLGSGGDAQGDILGGIENLIGSAFSDMLTGDGAANTLAGGGSADTLIGGAGTDTADYSSSPAGVNVSLQSGMGSGSDAQGDTLSGIENLIGSAFGDTLTGDGGPNTLVGGGGGDMLSGGAGTDTADYSSSPAGVSVNLQTGMMSGGDAQGDTLSGIENLIGSAFSDALTGDGAANVLVGGFGGDMLTGGAGADSFMVRAPSQGADTFRDFSGREGDRILLDHSGFGLAGTGSLAAAGVSFVSGATPVTAGPTILDSLGNLSWDPDGTGPSPAVPLAHVNSVAAVPNPLLSGWNIVATGAFNQDGIGDILWQNASTGATSEWLMGNGTLASNPPTPPAQGWNVIATADFSGDGITDLLWKHASAGATAEWVMAPNGGVATLLNTPAAQGWNVIATADFNGDHIADLLWRHASTGSTAEWLMAPNGGVATLLGTPPVQGWNLLATADFNGDGTNDLMWQHAATGATAEWLMAPTGGVGRLLSTPPAQGWNVIANDDFNGDGTTDVLWQNASSGATAQWLMAPTGGVGTLLGTPPAQGWHVVATADFNGDSITDLLWQQASTGATSEWLMAPTGGVANLLSTPPAQGWNVVTAADFNGDHIADVLWQHAATGTTSLWLTAPNGGVGAFAGAPPAAGLNLVATGDFNGDGATDLVWRDPTTGATATWVYTHLTQQDFLVV